MGRDTKAELQKCLRHNTALIANVEAKDTEIEELRRALYKADEGCQFISLYRELDVPDREG